MSRRILQRGMRAGQNVASAAPAHVSIGALRAASTAASNQRGDPAQAQNSYHEDAKASSKDQASQLEKEGNKPEPKPKHKTQAQLDEEMRLAMAGIAGEGGEAGVELEDGQPSAMKRSVRNNMFRLI